jgi:hypothetical protein
VIEEERCGGGKACGEVLDRLRAADRARLLGVDHDDPTIASLREQARRWADEHAHGTGGEP